MVTSSGNMKKCFTCAYWAGVREPYGYNDVRYEGITAKGTCMCKKSAWHGVRKDAGTDCNYHEKWQVLK